MSKYLAVASWNGRLWDVRMLDYDDRQCAITTAERLVAVQQNASAMLGARIGCLPEQVMVQVEVALPDTVVPFVDTAERHVALASSCLGTVVDILKQHGMTREDISALLTMRALTVTASRTTAPGL